MRTILGIAFLLLLAGRAEADAFEPKIADICRPVPNATTNGKVQPALLLNQLLDDPDVGVALADMPGVITPEREINAVLAGADYCVKAGPGCPDDDKARKAATAKFAHAQVLLIDYFQRHSVPVQPKLGGYQFTFTPTRANVSDFFLKPNSTLAPACVAAQTATGSPAPALATKATLPGTLLIRNSIGDLTIAQQSDAFKTLKQASLSITDDMVKDSTAYALQGVVGYGFGPGDIPGWDGARGQAIPFVSYTRQFVEGNNPNKISDVDNIGLGLIGDALLPAFPLQNAFPFTRDMYNDIALTTQVVHSDTTNTNILSGQVTYTPYIDPTVIPGIGTTETIGDFLVMLTPQFVFLYGDVLNSTPNAVLSQPGTYERIGTHVAFALKADAGVLSGFGINTSYDYQRAYGDSPISDIELFSATVSYTLPKTQFWSVQLTYADGRDLNTLQKQQLLTLGVGLKY